MTDSVAGKLLVAMPGIGDPRFEHAVILMCAHTAEHAMGLIVNKPRLALTLGEVLDRLGISPRREFASRIVLDGGPVNPDRGYVLHSQDYSGGPEASHDVAPGIRLTLTRDVLESLAGADAPAQFALALGSSGWGAGQLEDELRRNAWLVVEPDDEIVFGQAHEAKWAGALKQLGLDPAQLMGNAGHA